MALASREATAKEGISAPQEGVDHLIRVAVDNWWPRFAANGVDSNDFRRITSSLKSWDEWCGAWSASGEEHAGLGREAERHAHYLSAAQHYFQASMMYHFGKFMFFHRPEQYAAAHGEVVRLYERALPWFEFPGERVAIPFEHGRNLCGILRKPPHEPGPPVVIISPGLDSVKEEMHCYGDDYLKRRMAVLALDGPGQGEGEFDLPMRHDYEVPVRYAVDWLESRRDVDASRIGMMGVSIGGYNAVRALALEPRLKAAIGLALGYRLADYFDRVPVLTRRAFVHKLNASSEAEARRRLEAWDLHGIVENIRAPLLIIMGRLDALFPPEPAEEMARDAGPTAELLMLDDGNHVCNNVPYKYRPYEADWMAGHLIHEGGEAPVNRQP
jgi:2,6-dihydroxypseudooxynicotine hydrolase